MNPVEREDHNTIYKGEHTGPDGTVYNEGVGHLSCRREEPGTIVSHWVPDVDELAILTQGGHVELIIHAEPIPPVSLNAVPNE